MMTNQEDKEFLLAQREPGRRGRRGPGVDSVLAAQETRQLFAWKRPLLSPPAKKGRGCRFLICGAARVLSPSSSPNTSAVVSDEEYGAVGGASPAKRAKRATKNIVSPALAATLDQTQADRSFRDIRADEAARCLGQNVEELNINRSSIRRQTLETSCGHGLKIREEFRSGNSAGGPLGGQAVMDLTTKEHVDRLPIIISGDWRRPTARRPQVGKVAGGESMAAAVVSALETWGGRGSGSRDVLRHHGIQPPAAETGPVSSSNRNGEKPAAFRLSSPYPGAGGTCGVRPCSWVFPIARASALQTLSPKPHGRASTERTSGRESWWRKWRLF
ncbi:hypothetical protein GWK47_011746 [Chionoecetes opilio]|uniref:Uncharacterized protein n=1 Tax=Chionoecetes opilio TaxID=41210 RepID=A0A8J4Y2N7_CHIOP|nr:hypothetical protein GWK47_011746 [Chionoecetes opilio]